MANINTTSLSLALRNGSIFPELYLVPCMSSMELNCSKADLVEYHMTLFKRQMPCIESIPARPLWFRPYAKLENESSMRDLLTEVQQ